MHLVYLDQAGILCPSHASPAPRLSPACVMSLPPTQAVPVSSRKFPEGSGLDMTCMRCCEQVSEMSMGWEYMGREREGKLRAHREHRPLPKHPPAPPLSPGPVLSRKLHGSFYVTVDSYGVLIAGGQAGGGWGQAMGSGGL
jgi:hypothetical protein